jgi:hypothetical protein
MHAQFSLEEVFRHNLLVKTLREALKTELFKVGEEVEDFTEDTRVGESVMKTKHFDWIII